MTDAPKRASTAAPPPEGKRPRALGLLHAQVLSWPQEAEIDHLKALYPHARDADCHMEEATHT